VGVAAGEDPVVDFKGVEGVCVEAGDVWEVCTGCWTDVEGGEEGWWVWLVLGGCHGGLWIGVVGGEVM